jgi:hypothetical protein
LLILALLTALSVVIIYSPANPVALTKQLANWTSKQHFSNPTTDTKPVTPNPLPGAQKPAGKIFANDAAGIHKKMFDDILLALDSVHNVSKDPMIDSIWRFVRPRLVFIDSLPANPIAQADPIYVLPLLDSESSLSSTNSSEGGDSILGEYSLRSEHNLNKCITLFKMDAQLFPILAFNHIPRVRSRSYGLQRCSF